MMPEPSDPHALLQEQALLQQRARALAKPADQPVHGADALGADALEVLEFALAQERYAVETRHVREVLALRQLTPLPCTPSFVLGIVNVRGHMVPVLDLKEFLGLPQGGISQATYFNWKKKYARLLPTKMRRLRELEEENGRLKKIVADLTLDREMLQDVIRRKL